MMTRGSPTRALPTHPHSLRNPVVLLMGEGDVWQVLSLLDHLVVRAERVGMVL